MFVRAKPKSEYRGLLFLAPLIASFWPVWRWYLARISDGSDEPWGLVALLLGVGLVLREQLRQPFEFSEQQLTGTALLVATSIFIGDMPPMVHALLGVGAVTFLLWGRTRIDIAIAFLLVLSLPILSSLEFYLGYPLRLILTWIVGKILTFIGGLDVVASGTLLIWGERTVVIDSPCSGVHMLWVGLFLASALGGVFELGTRETVRAVVFAIRTVLIGNIARTTLLFYKESGIVPLPDWTHAGIGLVTFGVVAVMIVARVSRYSYVR